MVNTIKIWAPRFHDKTVLIAPHHIKTGVNRIVFTKTLTHLRLLMDADKIKSYPMQSNGSIGCYAVPMADFEEEADNQEKLFDEQIIDGRRIVDGI